MIEHWGLEGVRFLTTSARRKVGNYTRAHLPEFPAADLPRHRSV